MKRIIITAVAVALLAAFTPAQASAFHGGGCGIMRGIGRVFGVQRRQARRAEGRGLGQFGYGARSGTYTSYGGGCANGTYSR